jgi:hypothetical protein
MVDNPRNKAPPENPDISQTRQNGLDSTSPRHKLQPCPPYPTHIYFWNPVPIVGTPTQSRLSTACHLRVVQWVELVT